MSLDSFARPPLRIALLSAEYPPSPGGVGDYTRRLGESLAARGHQVFAWTVHRAQFTSYDLSRPEGQREAQAVGPLTGWGWRCWGATRAAVARLRPDVLHIQYQTGAYGMHPAINLLPWRLGRSAGRPAVAVTAHDLLPPYLFPKAGPLRRWVTRRLLADADAAVVTNADDYAQAVGGRGLAMRGGAGRSAAIIPIGSNIAVAPPQGYGRAAWRAGLGVAADEVLVAYFGLIGRSKGLDVLLRALARLPQRFRLLAIGGAATAPDDRAYAEQIGRLVDALGLRDRVRITGHCREDEVSAHLLAADLAALPFADGASFRRGSLLAALAHGVPTVTTRPPAEREAPSSEPPAGPADAAPCALRPLADGESVALVRAGDAAALAAAIERLAGDAALRARLGAGGRALAAQFRWESIAEQHERLYRRVLGR